MAELRGRFTHMEILSQPEAWASALEVLKSQREAIQDLFRQGGYEQVLFTGCGSTYYLSLAAAPLWQELTGHPARAFPASELWLYPKSSYSSGRTLLVAISRSGETTETLRAAEAFLRDDRGDLLTLSCYPRAPLAGMGSVNLVLASGQERSVAQTRAFSTLHLATTALAALCLGRDDLLAALERLPAAGKDLLGRVAAPAAQYGSDQSLDRFFILGSGARYGLACELSLKMKEMSLSHCEPFHFMEFRHGPKSMVTPATLIIGLLSSANRDQESAVLEEMKALGGRILTLGEDKADVTFASGISESMRNVLYLPFGQLLAFERSLSKGLNPDRPHHLDAVVKLT